MILDTITNASVYEGLHAGIDMALKAMAAYTPENYETGKVELDGDKVFLLRNAYTTNDPANAKFEAHRAYADVMYMVEGEETIYVKPVSQLRNITSEYNPEGDYLLADFDEDATPVHLTAGSFIILLPQDAHAPNCRYGEAKNVKKIVGKVLL
jgi:YhcH/YjgK/YiaL family protein